MKRGIAAVLGLMMVSACTHVDEEALGRLRAGKTTAAEAIRALGSPDRDETLPDGSRMLTYMTTRTTMRPANVLPGLVYAWGGWDATTDEAGLMFAPNGVLRFYSWSSNQRVPIKVLGHDIVAPSASEPMVEKQGPPPVSEKGAASPHQNSAD